jgi:hypothetical protein
MISFRGFLIEGGWSKKETQSTKLTPAIAKKAVAQMPKFERDFNAFLKDSNLPPIKIGSPVGSSAYIERDLKQNPEKEYGDIDIQMIIPRLDGMSEAKNNGAYVDAVKAFAGAKARPYMLHDTENFGNSVIISVGPDQWAQVDLVRTFGKHVEWATARMTPEHNLKGALLGNLYTSFGDLLHISMGPNGVFAKEKGGELVPTRTLKPDKVHDISLNISTFAHDIVQFISKRAGKDAVIDKAVLKAGMNKDDIKASDLAALIKGTGRTFEKNDLFGKPGPLKHIPDYDSFIDRIKMIYIEKNAKAALDAKFDKAETPEAKARAEATKDALTNKAKQVAALLD